MNFKPSDKVVMVRQSVGGPTIAETKEDGTRLFRNVGVPELGKVYTVERVIFTSNGQVGLALSGIIVICCDTGIETGWDHRLFRKLEEIQAENKLKREQEEAAALKEATQLINSEP